jgi:penicillin-binding protein 1A
MTTPLTAGEHLIPPSGPRRPRREPPPPLRRGRNPFVRLVRGLFGALLGVVVLGSAVGAAGGYVAWRHYSANLPDVDGLKNYQPPVMSRVFAGDGRMVAELAAERRIFVPFSAIPDVVKQAFVSAEDQNFWVHNGVDPLAIARAGVFDVMHLGSGRRPIGASTITQQVAKNMLLDNNEVSMGRKIREALLAMRIEQVMSKQRVLELYLNEIYLGLGSYGVAAAAQAYFNKGLDQLTLPEAAFLAGLPKAPNNLNPFKYPDAARARRDYVLDRMADDHAITVAQATAAKATPIIPAEFHRPAPVPGAEWFTEEVRQELIQQFGQDVTTQGGLMVRTSLDPALQIAAERSVRDGLMAYDRKLGGWRGPVTHLDVAAGGASGGTAKPGDTAGQGWAGQGLAGQGWTGPLAQVAHPPGMLPDWRLAVVLSLSDSEAKLGWLEPAAQTNQPPQPRTGVLTLADVAWARPATDGKLGPAPRKMADVVQPGDVVMVEPASLGATAAAVPAGSAAPAGAAAPAASPALAANAGKSRPAPAAQPAPVIRLALRQIPQVQGALVSLDPTTGRVLAMVGGWSYEQSQFNRATQAQRQPGSSFKPFVYLTALEHGISPSQRFLDAPVVIDTPDGKWRPGNYEGNFGGPTPLRVALEQSLNLVTLRVAQHVGMQAIADNAIAFHEVDNMPRVLPAALGAVQTTVLKEAGAYASLDEGGREVLPTLIDSVQDRDGQVVWRPSGLDCEDCSDPSKPPLITDDRKQIADPQSVFQLITMMQGVVQRGTGMPVAKDLGRPIAGKTGTTQDFTDAWFGGFTPDLVTVVWVGYDNPASLGNNETGANVAGPIWHDYMAVALKNRPVLNFPQPPGVVMAQWDTGSGMVTDAFKPDELPGASAPVGMGVASQSTPDGATPAAGPRSGGGGGDMSLGGLY